MISLKKYLTLDEQGELETMLLRYLGHPKHGRNALMLMVGLHGGGRPQETLNLTWADFSADLGGIHFETLKGGNPRMVPLPPWLLPWFPALRDAMLPEFKADDQRIFPITYRQMAYIWTDWYLGPKTLHSLRHTFAVRLFDRTNDLALVSLALGHKNLSTTQVYLANIRSFDSLKRGFGY